MRPVTLAALVALAACAPAPVLPPDDVPAATDTAADAATDRPDSAPAACTPACSSGQACVGGACFAPVADAGGDVMVDVVASDADVVLEPRCTPQTLIWCEGACWDPLASNANCGRCNNPCTSPETCFMGRCARP